MGLEMADEEEPKFMKAVLWAALLIGGVIGGMILQSIQWVMADNLGLGWSEAVFIRDRLILIGYGIVVPAIVIGLSIIGSKIYKETEYITLIFGIIIAAIGTLLAIVTGVQIGVQTGEYFDKLGTGVEVTYIPAVILAAVGVVFSAMLALAGKDIIIYYYSKQAL